MDKESALILRSLVISINREAMNELIEQEMNPLASEVTATESLKKIYYTSIEAREHLDSFLINEPK